MKYKQGTRRKPIEYEKDLVKYWKKRGIFEKSVNMRPKADSYVFYDGPPFITGVPHHGTLLSSIVKDAVPRYFTMKGKHVERVWGWDCHGLPAEVYTEKKLGIKDKRDIGTKITLEDYIKTCRENMVQTGDAWEGTIERIGRWVDFKGAYKTMDKPYMESVWWAFKKLYEAGKIYEGEKVLLYCTRDATPISKAEVAMDNSYQDVTDPSVYVKLRICDDEYQSYMLEAYEKDCTITPEMSETERKVIYQKIEDKSPKTYLLAWTTTPWTLPANTAVAINKDIDYVKVELNGERLILAKDALSRVLTDEKHQPLDYKVIEEFKGEQIRDFYYEPLFEGHGKKAHSVWHASYVTTEEGTGIVHLAPAYGEEDYIFAKEKHIPMFMNTDEYGVYTSGPWKGQNVWEANKEIAKTLHEQGKVWKIEYIRHSYPHCHRCGSRLIYRAHPSWFMDVTSQRQAMLSQNSNIHWFPGHFKEGRFAKNIAAAPDWNLSRDRFWATAMPVWKGVDKHGKEHIQVVGSYAELKELSGVELEDYHRPWIDEVTFEKDGVTYARIDKVLDCWFESGSMPFAQFHYPFENQDKFEQNFPGDFIAEYVPQVRAWFYYLHAINVGLFGKNAFKNVIVTGTLIGSDGRKLSKSLNNFTDPNILMDEYSADSLRFLLLSSPVLNGEDFSLQDKDVSDITRKLNMIWNMFDFFTLYASVDGWEWNGKLEDPYQELTNPLDQWIVSRVHQLTAEVDAHMQEYDIPSALNPVIPFIDDASNWYVRRSRKRFWKSDNDNDKAMAYKTLHYVLVRLSLVLAPFTPFLAEELYMNLTGGESVHLCDWPQSGQVNGIIMDEMAIIRELISQGLSQRASSGIKVRQPLAKASVVLPFNIAEPDMKELQAIMTEELNIKSLKTTLGKTASIKLDTKLTSVLEQEGYARELIRAVQNTRKKAGFEVDDRIDLCVQSEDSNIRDAVVAFRTTIMAETLTVNLNKAVSSGHSESVLVDGKKVDLTVKKTVSKA